MWFPAVLKSIFLRSSAQNCAGEFESEEDTSVDPFNPFPEPVVIQITDVFDLHTVQPRDVKLVVEEYLSEAERSGFRKIGRAHV